MHPAFSVIFLTTLIGMGQGLFLALYTEQLYSAIKVLESTETSQEFYALASFVSLLLLILGLFASFFHLGHPERAWRSAAMWRTSWLSREVIALPTFMFFVFVYSAVNYIPGFNIQVMQLGSVSVDLSLLVGAITTVFAFTLFVCTGMIYACLKFLQEWHSPLTLINYILLGGASGFTLATLLAMFGAPHLVSFFASWAMVLTLVALVFRVASLMRNKRLRPASDLRSATGIRHTQIKQKTQGSMGGSFNTREYFHNKTLLFVRNLKWIFLVLVFVIPTFCLGAILTQPDGNVIFCALISQYIGLLAERWYFFADAKHPQNLYYQVIS
jgi:sulfite dehydrogenase (quinone) subunit SoeC